MTADLTNIIAKNQRVVSGMRPTGRMHLGHYFGALQNWLQLQHEQECLFFAGDLHALTTHYDDPALIKQSTIEMIEDWLAAGLNPKACKIFIQSEVPEHTELCSLLAMITPLSWLERVPTYKEQQNKLSHKDLTTYGFLGYPALMAADILVYRANLVPVGEDQLAHLELVRQIARRFNHLYGKEQDFQDKITTAINKMGKKPAAMYQKLCKQYQEQGDVTASKIGTALLDAQHNLSLGDRERLQGYLEGTGKIILSEPAALLTTTPKLLGVDGQKMSKSYHNSIFLTEAPDAVAKKVRNMVTDPARVKRTDPGTPEKCPVWQLHKLYSSDSDKDWVQQGCTTAGIGCLDCKKALSENIIVRHAPIRERAQDIKQDSTLVQNILQEGRTAARDIASDTLKTVKIAMGINHD
ncbi:MAG: tryptophan--tRNA ligase [Legionellales bacterium]|nr:MAG: tryptophan--tRNA ligase [Legionellales bacterium]